MEGDSFLGLYLSLVLLAVSITSYLIGPFVERQGPLGGAFSFGRLGAAPLPSAPSSCASHTIDSLPSERERLAAAIRAAKYDVDSFSLPANHQSLITLAKAAAPTKHHVGLFGNSLRDAIALAVRQGKPSLLLGATAHWPILDSFDVWGFAHTFPVLTGVLSLSPSQCIKANNSSWQVFVIDSRGEDASDSSAISLSSLAGARRSSSSTLATRDMLTVDFLGDARSEQCGDKRFYSMSYSVLERITANALGEARWREFQFVDAGINRTHLERLWVDHTNSSGSSSSSGGEEGGIGVDTFLNRTSPQFWLLPTGAALQCRASEYHTMRVQLRGQAQYSLFPPHWEAALRPFPTIHVSAGQAQRDMYADPPVGTARPEDGGASTDMPVQVTLTAGQTLYIPPYWHVHSEGIKGLSAVLDVPSPSLQQLVLKEGFYMALPFDGALDGISRETAAADGAEIDGSRSISSREQRVLAVQVFLVHLLSRVRSSSSPDAAPLFSSPKKFSEQLYASRYSQLYPDTGLALRQARDAFQCLRKDPALVSKTFSSFVLPRRKKILKAAEFIADCVNDPAVLPAVRSTWLFSYAEQLASFAMRDASQAVTFLLECLDQQELLPVIEEVEGPPVVKLAV